MRLTSLSLLLTALLPSVYADVKFTSPAGGETFTGGGSIKIAWTDSEEAPSLSDLTTYQLFLCAGGNDNPTIVQLLDITDKGTFANGNVAEGTIPATIGASTPTNAYFFKIISVASAGGTVTNYSPRFSLSGMTGVLPASALQGANAISGTSGPARVNAVANAQDPAAAASSGATGSFAVPFMMQTGPIKYAPMQTYPPTKITAKTKTPLNPTSPYTIATTYLPAPTIQSTMTQQVTWSFSQIENPAPAAAMPSDDMQKFLNRWKD